MKLNLFVAAIGLLASSALAQDEAKPALAVVYPEGEAFESVVSGVERELGDEYTLERFKADAAPAIMAKRLEAKEFKGIIALDGPSLDAIVEYQKTAKSAGVPIFVGATLQVKSEVERRGIKDACGVEFEVPAFTQFSNLKFVSTGKFDKVGVLYRSDFDPMIQAAKTQLAQTENLELIGYCIDCDGSKLDEKTVVKKLDEGWKKIGDTPNMAFWLLADNGVLTNKTLAEFWLKKVAKAKVPVVAPLEMFVNGQKGLGEMALMSMGADYVELGSQIAGNVRAVLEDGETAADQGFEPLVSVKKALNTKKADKIDWELNSENLSRVDKLFPEK